STASQPGVPATLKSASDVRKADKALDNTAIDGQVNPNRLDSDLDALL
ncbi:MAG: hypothetical protein JWL89_400, partial [Candidatus Saccharibacteria bacterium]|nr:hypothetical protein [Candidatus Saccharibacteria bacterium]